MSLVDLNIKKNFSLVFISNLLSNLLFFIVNIIVARFFDIESFATFSIFITISWLLTFFIDSGLSTTSLKFICERKFNPREIIGTLIWLRIFTSIFIMLIFLFFGKQVIDFLCKTNCSFFVIQIMVLSSIVLSLVSFLQVILQSEQKFQKYSLITILIGISRLFAVIAVLFFENKNLELLLFVYFTSIIIPFLVAIILNFKQINLLFNKKILIDILHFSKWIIFFSMATVSLLRIDYILLGILSSKTQLAKYAVSFQIAFIIPLITISITTVFFPKILEVTTLDKFKRFVRTLIKFSPVLLSVCLTVILFSEFIIRFLLTSKYAGISLTLDLLITAFVIGFFISIMNPVFYALNIPDKLFYLYLAQLILTICLDIVLIPQFGSVGSAISALIIRVMGVILCYGILFKTLNKNAI